MLPTDTQKQTIYAYAKEIGIGQIEDFALALGRHFVNDTEPVEGCRIEIDEYAWERVSVAGPDGTSANTITPGSARARRPERRS